MIEGIKAIVFDKDGVLFDTEMIIIECWKVIGKQKNINGIENVIKKCIGLNKTDTVVLLKKTFGDSVPFMNLMEEAANMSRAWTLKNGLPVKEGAYEALDFLKESEYRIALASSSSTATIKKHLKESNMEQYFEQVIGGDSILHSKPLPDIYLNICEKLKLLPEQCIAIEDSPNGIISAYRAGMKPIMVPDLIEPTPEIEGMLYRKFDSLLQVRDFLKKGTGKETV